LNFYSLLFYLLLFALFNPSFRKEIEKIFLMLLFWGENPRFDMKGEMMKFEYLKLNRNRKIIKRMSINLDDYIAVLSTGYNWKLMREKGRPLELYDMITFDDFSKLQRQNDEAVERRTFSYIYHGDGRKISDKVRDEKGRPLKEYTKPEDMLGKAIKLNYIEGKELFKYAKEKGILFYDDDRWREILKDQKIVL